MSAYPEWQNQMREEQAAAKAVQEKQYLMEQVAEEERQKASSAKVAEFLLSIGLPVGERKGTGCVIGNFYFSIYNPPNYAKKLMIHRIAAPEYQSAIDEGDSIFDRLWEDSFITDTEGQNPNSATAMRVWIANTFDQLEEEYKRVVDRCEKRRAGELSARANPAVLKTQAERLFDLLCEIIDAHPEIRQ